MIAAFRLTLDTIYIKDFKKGHEKLIDSEIIPSINNILKEKYSIELSLFYL